MNGGELVKALASASDTGNEVYIELDRAASNLQRTSASLEPGWYFFLGRPRGRT